MSYSREEFEQAVTDRWSDSYSFTRFGDEDYYDEVLEGMWWGWQASRQEGEPIGFLQSSGVSQLSGGHPAKLYPIGATPSPFESSTFVYTHPASAAPDEEYLRALQDAFDIIQADANTEENYGSMCRIGSVLGKLKDTPTNADVWIKCSDRLPNLGQRVILKSRGVVQNYMPVFDQGGDDRGMGDHFWDFEDINDIDNPLVDFENDSWMPKPKQEQGE